MLDLRQLETLAPSPRDPGRDSVAVIPSGSGNHGQQAPGTLHAVQVSPLSPSSLEISKQPSLAGLVPTAGAQALIQLCSFFPSPWAICTADAGWGWPGGVV